MENSAASSWGPGAEPSESESEEGGGSRRKLLQKQRKEIKDLQAASKRAIAGAKMKGEKQRLELEFRQKEADLVAAHKRQLAALSKNAEKAESEEAKQEINGEREETENAGVFTEKTTVAAGAASASQGRDTGAPTAVVTASPGDSADAVVNAFASLRLYGGDGAREPAKLSKAQQRRRKKRTEDEAREEALRLEREEAGPDPGQVEWELLRTHLQKRNLAIHSIAADGHCMYRGVCHQLQQISPQGVEFAPEHPATWAVEQLRDKVADFLEANREEFQPFLDDSAQTEQGFANYCGKIRNTAEWGGEVELQVIAKVLQRRIQVATMNQGEFLLLTYGEEFPEESSPLRLTFHRHLLAAGGHYNSVVPASSKTSDSDVE
uniref:OTU family cysteine protease n=1 Tax=Toxoplasma gondii TgCATBr9 TaxID=943120 RepID=A0A2T6IPL5_TOXGO|nr:OTU family cysteine protease [Toxoplasma gondii TgCATBr9]